MDCINNLTYNSLTGSFNSLSSTDWIFIISLFVIVPIIIGGVVGFLFQLFQRKDDAVEIVQTKKSAVDEKITRNLCELPVLVLEKVLGYLDSKSLRMLRLVSQKTKSWIDRPCYIEKIPIYINNQIIMERIMNSNVEWSNINIVAAELCSDVIIPFIQHFRLSLKIINIKAYSNPQDLWIILRHVSPQLETLGMNLVDLNPTDFNDKLCETLKENLIGLKYLNLNYVLFHYIWVESIQCEHFLEQLFSVCQNLRVIKFPQPNRFQEELQAETIFRPVISYLRTVTVSSIQPCLKKIYLPCLLISTFSRDLFDSEIPSHLWQTSIMRELVRLCEPLCIELFNIPCNYLPNTWDVSEYEMLCLNKCVKTVVSKSSNIGILSNMYIPSNCEIHVGVFVTSVSNHSNFELAANLNITQIYLKTDSTAECITETQTIYNNLLQTFRPSLHMLALTGKSCFAEVKLSLNFPNLKELWIGGYNNPYFERLDYMMNGLENLETLNCYDMSPTYFIGVHKDQWRSKFKKLTHINIMKPSNFEIDLTGNLQTTDF